MSDVGNEPDERLLVEAAKQDRSKFADLYELHFQRVYAFIGRRGYNRAEVQDLTSEVFRKALAGLDGFEWRGVPFAAWLFRIATNVVLNHRQRAARESGTPEPDTKPPGKMASMEEVENRATLYRLVADLPADQRRVIELRFAEEKGIREIAQELGRTEGAVKQLQFRAIQNLRERMGERDG